MIVELNTPLRLPVGVSGATGSAEWQRTLNREVALVTTGAANDGLMGVRSHARKGQRDAGECHPAGVRYVSEFTRRNPGPVFARGLRSGP